MKTANSGSFEPAMCGPMILHLKLRSFNKLLDTPRLETESQRSGGQQSSFHRTGRLAGCEEQIDTASEPVKAAERRSGRSDKRCREQLFLPLHPDRGGPVFSVLGEHQRGSL